MPANTSAPKKSPPRKHRADQVAAAPALNHRITLARHLDRGADALLFLGNHLAAERLATRAQMLRETGC